MAKTEQTFNTLDSDICTDGSSVSAHLMQQVGRNLNRLLKRLHQPCLSRGYESADVRDGGYPDSEYSLHVNAPPGAFAPVVPPCGIWCPPVANMRGRVRAEVASGQTLYLWALTSEQPFSRVLSTADAFSVAGTGSADDYASWTVPIKPRHDGPTWFAVVGQTTGFTRHADGVVSSATAHTITRNSTTDGLSDFSAFTDEHVLRDDVWVTVLKAEPIDKCWVKTAASAWTDETVDINDSDADDVSPFSTSTAGDEIYFGMPKPYGGILIQVSTAGVGSYTVAHEYSQGSSSYASLTRIPDTSSGYHWDDFTEGVLTRANFWQVPTDWEQDSEGSSNQDTRFWTRIRLASGSPSTKPLLQQAWALTEPLLPWTRVAGKQDQNVLKIPVHVDLSRVEADRGVFLVGKAAVAEIHAIHFDPEPDPGIT